MAFRASFRLLIRRRKLKRSKSTDSSPILTSTSVPDLHSPTKPITPSMISSPTNIITIPDRIAAAPAIELKPALKKSVERRNRDAERRARDEERRLMEMNAGMPVGRDVRMTRHFTDYVVPPMPPVPVAEEGRGMGKEGVQMERMVIRKELSEGALRKARRRSTIALSTYNTHSVYYAPLNG